MIILVGIIKVLYFFEFSYNAINQRDENSMAASLEKKIWDWHCALY